MPNVPSADASNLPGQYVRDTALTPNNVSVSDAAKVLGVSRPALSNFLNGNAAVSPDMAARIERAFGIPAQTLFDMQAAQDAALAKEKGAPSATKAYVPPFLEIKANEIADWAATTISARVRLSVLLRTLVNSTGIGLSRVDFPGNDDAQRAGKDGNVVAAEGTPWVPKGRSCWEFGCNQKPKAKADQDYENKTTATEKAERDESIFVFVTPRRWPGKQKWEDARRAEEQWKDIRALDASDLEQWMEQSIAAQTWFATETHRPSNGAYSLDSCWADWANVSDPPLPGSLFDTATGIGAEIIKSRLAAPPDEPTIIAADSTEEGLAFLAQLFTEAGGELEAYRDRTVVFQETGVLPKLAAGSTNFIAVATTRDVERELAPYCHILHCIVVYPRNAANLEPHVVLEPLYNTAFRASLEDMGIDRDDIDRFSRESGRSLTVLRRRLSKVPAIQTPQWVADTGIASRLVPFLFGGAWSSINTSDQTILSLLAGGIDYPELEKELQALAGLNDAPVWSIGAYRGVISKMDLLFAVAGTLTEPEITNYFEVARLVLSEDDPSLDLPEEDRWAAGIYGKTRQISAALRDSISETLVLLAVHGNALFQKRLGINVEAQVAQLVRDLLTPLTTRTLEAQERDLPTYAEAAPDEFLSILEEDLDRPEPASLTLMRPVESGTFGRCVRSGLLWALEGLAWPPGMLPRTAMILAKLAQIQIDDNWANKPIESLRSTFRSWMPQTEATLEQRIAVIERLAEEVPDIAWQICVDQFDIGSQVGHYSHKPRWRNDGHGFGEPLRNEDVSEFQVAMLEMALAWKSHDRETLGDLITRIFGLDESRQATVWELVKRWENTNASDEDKAWVREKIRVTVMSKRAVRRNRRRKVNDVHASAEAAYKALEPTGVLNKHEWLFRQEWVEESADEQYDDELDLHTREERIVELRTEALREIVAERGVDGVIELAEMGNAPGRIGYLMTVVLPKDQIASFILVAMPPGTDSWTRNNLVYGALHALKDEVRTEILSILRESVPQGHFAAILRFAPFDSATWLLVDELDGTSQESYWADVSPDWRCRNDEELNERVERLLAAKRPRAAFACVHFELKKIRPVLLFRLLSEIATGKHEPPGHYPLDSHYIIKAFKELDTSGEFSTDQMAGLEFPYIEALTRERSVGGIPNLELYIESHPEFFAEVVSWVFKRREGADDSETENTDDPELRKSRAERGYSLLKALKRIPGHNKLGEIDTNLFHKWLKTVRESCAGLGRQTTGDIMLGELTANAPCGSDGIWPCEPVRTVLERVRADDIARGIRTGLYNLRGAHWRGEGGDQERDIATKYRRWATALEFSYPFVATILKGMAESYDEEAKGQDVDAEVERRLG